MKRIRFCNQVLLFAATLVIAGFISSQFSRAKAFVVIGCGDNDGSIGTPPSGCTNPQPTFCHWDCKSGVYSNPSNPNDTYEGKEVCCQYAYNRYYCQNVDGSQGTYIGIKGDLIRVKAGTSPGQCVCSYEGLDQYEHSNEECWGGSVLFNTADDTDPTPTLGPHDPDQ